MPTYVVLLGPPGAGKGAQANQLAEKLSIPQVSTGDLFRAMKTQDTPLARRVQEIMASGKLVPDDLTVEIVRQRLAEEDCRNGAILDGFPRTVPQAEALDEMLGKRFNSRVTVVPLLDVPEEESVRRISGRRSCPTCKRVYHVEFDPPQQRGRCDDDGVQLVQREDDKPETVAARYRVYQEKTAPLIDFYRDKGLLVEVNAVQPIDTVAVDLLNVVQNRMRIS